MLTQKINGLDVFNSGDTVYHVFDDWATCETCNRGESTVKWGHEKAEIVEVRVEINKDGTSVTYDLDSGSDDVDHNSIFGTEEAAKAEVDKSNSAGRYCLPPEIPPAVISITIKTECALCGEDLEGGSLEINYPCSLEDLEASKIAAAKELLVSLGHTPSDPVKAYAANKFLEEFNENIEAGVYFIEDFDPVKIKQFLEILEKDQKAKKEKPRQPVQANR